MDPLAKNLNTSTNPYKKRGYGKKRRKSHIFETARHDQKGRTYLNRYKKDFPIPIIAKLSSFDDQNINLDTKAARIYAMGLPVKYRQKAIEMEYTQQPVYIQE